VVGWHKSRKSLTGKAAAIGKRLVECRGLNVRSGTDRVRDAASSFETADVASWAKNRHDVRKPRDFQGLNLSAVARQHERVQANRGIAVRS
jgi:hypothetical protein